MKRFKELTQDQKEEAVNFAYEELKSCLLQKMIYFDKPVNESVLRDYAVFAAEDAWYSERTDKVVEDIV